MIKVIEMEDFVHRTELWGSISGYAGDVGMMEAGKVSFTIL